MTKKHNNDDTNYKGIVLAGGHGSRMFPITKAISKQLIPIYDKPLIYYPISILMLAGIRDILIICTKTDLNSYKKLLGDGSLIGVNFHYKIQEEPRGIGEAFIIGSKFIGKSNVCLILGDNIFYGGGISGILNNACSRQNGATIFGYRVHDPQRFGVAILDKKDMVIEIQEKPMNPSSNIAVTGLYFYDNNVLSIANTLKPSKRGELEITDINNAYIKNKSLKLEILGRGHSWLDTGTPQSLHDASNFVQTVQTRQGLMIACLEEIAYHKKWISKQDLVGLSKKYKNSIYGEYLSYISSSR